MSIKRYIFPKYHLRAARLYRRLGVRPHGYRKVRGRRRRK